MVKGGEWKSCCESSIHQVKAGVMSAALYGPSESGVSTDAFAVYPSSFRSCAWQDASRNRPAIWSHEC